MNIPDLGAGEVAAGGAGLLGVAVLVAKRLGVTLTFGGNGKAPDPSLPQQCADHSAFVVQIAEMRDDVHIIVDRQNDIGENVAAVRAVVEESAKAFGVVRSDINTLYDRMRENETRTTVLEKKGG